MNREQIIAVLYDMALVIGGETNLQPLLTKTLQRLLYHTGFPCGMIFLYQKKEQPSGELLEMRLETAIGDYELSSHAGTTIPVPASIIEGGPLLVQDRDSINKLPCKKDRYSVYLRLPIPDYGVVILISPSMPETEIPFTNIFQPVMKNLSKAINLCQKSEAYTKGIILERDRIERQHEILLKALGEGVYGVDTRGITTFINPAAAKMLGFEPDELIGRHMHSTIHHTRADGAPALPEECQIYMSFRDGKLHYVSEDIFWRKDGTSFYVDYVSTPVIEGETVIGAVVAFQDITERRKASAELKRLNRFNSMLSGINQATIHVRNRDELFGTVCRIAVEQGEFRMAWIGIVEPDTQMVKPVAHSGVLDNYLENIRVSINADVPEGRGPTGTALREGRHFVCNDIEHAEFMLPWRDEALKRGYRSSASFPLIVGGKIEGSLNIYSSVPNFFDEKEEALLAELSSDISFALEFLRKEELRKQAEEAIHKSNELMEKMFSSIHVLIAYLDKNFNFIKVNRAYATADGREPEFFPGKNHFELYPYEENKAIFQKVVATGEPIIYYAKPFEYAEHPDRGVSYWDWRLEPIKGPDGKVEGLIFSLLDVTDKTLAQKKIEESEAYVRSLIEASLDPLVTISPDGKITDVNKTMEEVTGLPRERLIGSDIRAYFARPERVGEGIQKVLTEGFVKDFPMEIRHTSGRLTRVLYHATVYRDSRGDVRGIFGAARDVTEREKMEETLRQSEASLKESQRIAHIGSWELDLAKDELIWSDETYRIFNIAAGTALTYEKFLEMVHPDDRSMVDMAWTAALQGKPYDIEHRILVDGALKWVREKGEVEFSTEGKALRGVGAVQDITERKLAEEGLKKSAARLNEAQRIAHIGNWELDLTNNILTWSDEIYRIFEIDPAKFGASYEAFLDTIHPEDRTAVDFAYTNSVKTKTPYAIDHRLLFPDGRIKYVYEQCETSYDKDGKPIRSAGTVQDITERKLAEEKLKEEMDVTSHLLMMAEATAKATDIDTLMSEVIKSGHIISGCDICLSYLWDRDARLFKPSQYYGLSHELIPLFMTEALEMSVWFVEKAFVQKTPLFVPLETLEPAEYPGEFYRLLSGIKALAVIPLTSREENLGLLVSIFTKPMEFTERLKRMMEGISHQVSLALEKASLYRDSVDKAIELSNKIETIQTMHEIDRSILSTLNPQEILETVTVMVSRLLPCDRAMIAISDMEKKGFIYKAGFGLPIQIGSIIPIGETSAAKVLETRRPEYIGNMAEIRALLPFERSLFAHGFHSHIRFPIIVKGEAVGVLDIGSKRPAAFTLSDRSTLERVIDQVGIALENARLVSDMEELFLGVVKALSSAIDAKSHWTAGHSERVTEYAILIGKEMGLSDKELRHLELAGFLHDVGKIGTYEAILDKPGILTEEEHAIVKKHPVQGAEIVGSIKQLKDIAVIIRSHQENYDGSGYPDGLKGEEIPLLARVLLVADSFDAMTADRPYRKTPGKEKAIEEIKRLSGTQFDPRVVEAFLRIAQAM